MASCSTPAPPQGDWTLALVSQEAWRLVDLLRALTGRPTRSDVAEDLVRRALSIDAKAAVR